MTRRYAAPMPDALRHMMRSGQHPARSQPCPWCGARAHKPCTTPSKRHRPQKIHQQRMAAWALAVACCPTCQVTPAVPCHLNGQALPDGSVHAARYAEADRTAS